MRNTILGNTEREVSVIGLGLAALGRPGYINIGHAEDLRGATSVEALEARTHAVLDAALEAGVTYVDAARSYGRAEEFVAHFLRTRDLAGTLMVGSKWGYTYTGNWQAQAETHEVKEHSLEVLERQTRESRTLLDSHLDLYQIHSATLESGVLTNVEVLQQLARMRASGLRVGLTVTGPRQAETLERALDVRVDGVPLFDTVQATWNLLEQSATEVLARAHAEGLGVLIKEPVANGRLTARNDAASFASQRRHLAACADRLGVTIDALAISAALAQPWSHVVLSGAARVDHLHANLAALDVPWSDALADELASIEEPRDAYWSIRSKLEWN